MATCRVKEFDKSRFPALYRCADEASMSAQRCFLNWLRVNLGLLVAGAIVGSVALAELEHRRIAHIVTAAFFVAAVATTVLLATRPWEHTWYAGRAVAESVKSLSWKFVCRADPFRSELAEGDAIQRLLSAIGEILQENKRLSAELSGPASTDEQVTTWMLELRGSAVGVARDVYLAQRVGEQQSWYASKAAENRKHRNRSFWVLIAFQGLACGGAILVAVYPAWPWAPTAVLSTLASVTIAWLQVKRYQELSQAYGLAAHELSLVAARGTSATNGDELARFVNDAETAISREHSMWVARRETM